jgi:quinol monooxygenase YgiN
MIVITVKFRARPEFADGWAGVVDDFTRAVRAEPGNLWFEWSRSLDNPYEFVLIEAFRDEHAGAAHVNSRHFRTAMAELPQYISETPRVINANVEGDDWSPLAEMTVPEQ